MIVAPINMTGGMTLMFLGSSIQMPSAFFSMATTSYSRTWTRIATMMKSSHEWQTPVLSPHQTSGRNSASHLQQMDGTLQLAMKDK